MKILHVISSIDGGSGKAALRLHEGLLEQGVVSQIITLSPSNSLKKITNIPFEKSLATKIFQKLRLVRFKEKENKIKLLNVKSHYEYFSFCETSYDITKTKEYLEADIVNLHWVANLLDYPSFFSKNTKPLVWSLSDMNSFTGGCHYSNSCEKFMSNKCTTCPQLQGSISDQNAHVNYLVKEDSILQSTINPVVITPANWLYKAAKSSPILAKSKHIVIPHPSDETIYKPLNKEKCKEHFNLPKGKTIFLFSSGTLSHKRKGFSILIEAIKKLDLTNIHFLILGTIDSDISINETNYSSTGYIKDENELALAYNAVDSEIIPSFEDNLPLTLIDSMMCGTPSISFNVGGMQSHIIDGLNGYKAPKYSSDSLVSSIKLFLNNITVVDRSKITKHALGLYSKKKHCIDMLKTYNDLYR